MEDATARVTGPYDAAAPRWSDKMRTLGYHDGYLGFLSAPKGPDRRDVRIVDVRAGTAAFAEVWVAINGTPIQTTLTEPRPAMLERGRAALRRRCIEPRTVQGFLGEAVLEPCEVVLAAHVIEHCPDPLVALWQMRDLLLPGGRLHLVVSKPHWCNVIIWLQWRHRTFQEGEIVDLIQEAGFEIERVYDSPSRTSRGIVASRAN